jgi:hypothetical protein
MAAVAKLVSAGDESVRQRLGAKLDPALRAWADRVVIPALAREYLTEQEQKRIAESLEPVAQSERKILPSAGVTS